MTYVPEVYVRNSIAAWPSRMLMSEAVPMLGGVKVMLGPVGNSPGAALIVSVTATLLLIGLPVESTTVTSNHASCVPSTAASVVVLEVSFSPAAVPAGRHVRGAALPEALRAHSYHTLWMRA